MANIIICKRLPSITCDNNLYHVQTRLMNQKAVHVYKTDKLKYKLCPVKNNLHKTNTYFLYCQVWLFQHAVLIGNTCVPNVGWVKGITCNSIIMVGRSISHYNDYILITSFPIGSTFTRFFTNSQPFNLPIRVNALILPSQNYWQSQ